MKKMIILLGLLGISLFSTNIAHSRNAKVMQINIKKGQVVSQDIYVVPGLATIIEFPSDIIAPIAIPDRTVFSCERKIPAYNAIFCRPLATGALSTTAFVTTEHNEFILNLNVANSKTSRIDKYIFIDPSQRTKSGTQFTQTQNGFNENLLDTLLKDFSYLPCKSKVANDYLQLQCEEKIQIGTNTFIKFSLKSRNRQPIEIIKCSIVIQTLGGFTGLAIKSESPQHTEYSLSNKNIRFGEEIFGIIKVPNLSVSRDQRLVLHIYTSKGKEADLILNHLTQ